MALVEARNLHAFSSTVNACIVGVMAPGQARDWHIATFLAIGRIIPSPMAPGKEEDKHVAAIVAEGGRVLGDMAPGKEIDKHGKLCSDGAALVCAKLVRDSS